MNSKTIFVRDFLQNPTTTTSEMSPISEVRNDARQFGGNWFRIDELLEHSFGISKSLIADKLDF